MAAIEDTRMARRPLGGAEQGRIWGRRASDWADIQEGQCAAAYHAVFDKAVIGSETRLLDAGCGAGMALQLAAELGASVTGIDASAALLEVAARRLPGARLDHGDLERLPFEDDAFDVVTGFNAFQYAVDPVAALREACRVTRPGGKVFILTWGDPGRMEATALVAALKPLLPPAPPSAAGPFALSEPGKLEDLAASAGLAPREAFDVQTDWTYPDLPTALRGLGSSGVAVKAAETRGQDALDAAHEQALAPFAQPDGSYRIGAAFRVLMAVVPA